MLTLVLLALIVAIANVLDTFTDIVAITKSGVSPAIFGALNSVSYLIYLIFLLISGRLADRGMLRLQIVLIILLSFIYSFIMGLYTTHTTLFVLLLCLYGLYPILQSISRIVVTAYIHEYYQSFHWSKLLSRRVILTLFFEALIMLLISRNIEYVFDNISLFTVAIVLPALITWVIVKDPAVRIEKTLFRIETGVRRIESVVTDIITFTLLTNGGGRRYSVSSGLLSLSKRILSVRQVVLSTVIFRLSSAMLLVQLPVYLMKFLQFSSMEVLVIYGVAKSLLLVDFVLPITVIRKPSIALFIRALVPMVLVVFDSGINYLAIALVLGLIIYLNNKIDVTLYSYYIEALGRPESTRFIFISEFSGFVATLISGIILSFIGYDGIIYATAILLIMGGVLLGM